MFQFVKRPFLFAVISVLLLTPLFSATFAEQIAGGWSYVDFPAIELPEALQRGFDDNFGLVGATYQPILYLGSQVVAGLNHLVLCKITMVTAMPVETFALVVVYEDFAGSVSILSVSPIDFLSLMEE